MYSSRGYCREERMAGECSKLANSIATDIGWCLPNQYNGILLTGRSNVVDGVAFDVAPDKSNRKYYCIQQRLYRRCCCGRLISVEILFRDSKTIVVHSGGSVTNLKQIMC